MLISGGKVLAIDKVKHGNTLTGDGAFGELDVNTNVIATVASVSSISSTLDKKIDTASANLSTEIDKKEDKITYHYNAFDKIDKINGSALAGGNNVELEEGDNIKITPRQEGENVIYNIATPSYTSKDESLLKVDEYSLSAKNWLPEIKESSANAVDVVSANFGDTSNGITGYNGIGLNIPAQKDIIGGKSINVVTGTNNFTINLDTSADVIAYSAGYGLNLANHEFSVKSGFFALSADVDDKIKTLEQELAKLGFYVCKPNEVINDVPNDSVLDSEGKLSTSKVYLVKVNTAPTPDQYKEWIWDGSVWTCIGDTTMNLDGYATEVWVKNNFLSANALDLIARTSGNWDSVYTTVNTTSGDWNDVSSKLNINDFNAWSANADIDQYTGVDPIVVKDHKIYLSADYLSANALDELSGNWNSVYETVKTTSGKWNEVSSKANQTDLDDLSGKVETLSGELKTTSSYFNEKIETLSGELETTSAYLNEKIESLSSELESTSSFLSGAIDVVSAEFEKVVYTSATTNWDVTPYSAGQNINITNHTISSKDWLPEIQEASANAVDVVKSKFNTTPDNKFSGYDNTPFYVKQHTVTGTSPIRVREEGDEYNIEFEEEYKKFIEEVSAKLYTSALPTVESLTPNYLKVELVKNQDGTSAWNLSAAEQKNYQAGDYIDIDENDYINVTGLHNVTLSSTDESIGITATTGVNGDVNFNLSVDQIEVPNISGYNGISATFNKETNQYEVGFKENDYAYLFGHYGNNSTVTDGTILKLDSNNYHNISIDNDGYITLPQTTNKFTFCINEYIDDNNTQNHEYLLNKVVLFAKGGDSIVTSQNYYPSEVGSSNVTLALTIDNSISPKEYCIVYKGSDVAANKLKIEASILEEVTSLDSSRGEVDDYTGREPIRIVQNSRVVELLYDENVFTLKQDASLGAKKLTIEGTGGEVVNKEVFDKLLDSINSRIVETIPIGTINYHSYISAGQAISYIFRPMIEFEMNQQTTARIIAGNASAYQSQVMISVYELNETNYTLSLIWWSELKTLTQSKGEQILLANNGVGETRSIKPDGLYYVRMICLGQQIQQLLGLQNTVHDDLGDYDLVYVDSTTNTDPFAYIDQPAGSLGQTANSTLKPYVGFKNVGSSNS